MSTILVIDDDRSVVHLIQNAFHNQPDIKVISAPAAGAGIELLKSATVDTVLLDVVLPDLSGLDAYQQIQMQDGKLPVIFITVGGTSDTAIEAMKLGAFDYLLKPLDLQKV